MARALPPQLKTHTYDVLVIGGGINGSGEARDLALRGASVLVLHRGEPQKTTNNSSRLGHGGLRYLPHFEFGLVWESRRELATLLKQAPHLVRPLTMIVPVFKGDPYPYWMVKAGMVLYDWFVKKGILPKHKGLNPDQLLGNPAKGITGLIPGLRPDSALVGGFLYYDTQIAYPERLCIENLRDARMQDSPDQPVHVLGHTDVTRLEERPDGVVVTFEDKLNGTTHQAMARYVLNTSGPLVDKIIEMTQTPHPVKRPQMGPTKGTHIMVENRLGLAHTVYAPAKDGRPFFIIPFPVEHAGKPAPYLLIGTTDDKTWTSEYPTQEEINYLTESANHVMPALKLTPNQVYHAYSGFRPLPASNEAAGAVTRKHIIRRAPGSRIFHIIGGKITTFRSLSEEAGNQVIKALRRELKNPFTARLKHHGRSITANRPLPGGAGIENINTYKQLHVPQASQTYDVSPAVVSELINRYGSRYTEVLELTRPDPSDPVRGPHLKAPLTSVAPLILAQVLHAIRYEDAQTLMDVMTSSLKLDLLPGSGLDAVEAATAVLAREKQLTPQEQHTEIAAYQTYIANNHQWQQQNRSSASGDGNKT